MQNTSRFDDFLFTIVKETGGLEGLLHSIFSFLGRRTDFFYEADPGDKMGFPPGYAQRMLLGIMEVYQKEHYKKYPKKDPAEYAAKLKKLQEAAKEKEKKEEETKIAKDIPAESNKPTVTSAQPAGERAPATTTPATVEKKTTPPETQKPSEKLEQEAPNKPSSKDPKDTAISTYNGASTDKYNWSQNINEVTVQVPLPAGTRAKNLAVDITPTKLKVVLKTENRTIIEGDWYERVKADDSTWSVDEDTIVLNLEKANENIWKTVLKGDQEIDATKVDNSKPIQDFDSETQGALRKIVHEQQRKQMGLPSTEEEQQLEMLKKAWNAEGSPWKGTPFDPSKFNLPGSNAMNFDNSS